MLNETYPFLPGCFSSQLGKCYVSLTLLVLGPSPGQFHEQMGGGGGVSQDTGREGRLSAYFLTHQYMGAEIRRWAASTNRRTQLSQVPDERGTHPGTPPHQR